MALIKLVSVALFITFATGASAIAFPVPFISTGGPQVCPAYSYDLSVKVDEVLYLDDLKQVAFCNASDVGSFPCSHLIPLGLNPGMTVSGTWSQGMVGRPGAAIWECSQGFKALAIKSNSSAQLIFPKLYEAMCKAYFDALASGMDWSYQLPMSDFDSLGCAPH